jgi:hypothetical protein
MHSQIVGVKWPQPAPFGPVCRPGGLPWNHGPFTQAIGYDVKIEPGSVAISMETYCIKTAKQLFGEHPEDIKSPACPMEPGTFLTTADCPTTEEDQIAVDALCPFNYLQWLGKAQFLATMVMFQITVACSNCGRVAARPSLPGRLLLKRLCKHAFGKKGYRHAIVYRKQLKAWFANRVLTSADASPPMSSHTEEHKALDKKLASARLGGVIAMNGGATDWWSFLTRKPVVNAPAAEVYAVHYMHRKLKKLLKLLSYFAKNGVDIPHFSQFAPMLIQQDCRAARFLLHNPKAAADAAAEPLCIYPMRQDTIEGIIGTFATKGGKGGDMAADGMSKALAGAEFVSFVNWNSGRQMWRPFDVEQWTSLLQGNNFAEMH